MYWVLPQCTVKYENVILAKEEQVLQSIINKLIENLNSHGMKMNMGETNLIIISSQTS